MQLYIYVCVIVDDYRKWFGMNDWWVLPNVNAECQPWLGPTVE